MKSLAVDWFHTTRFLQINDILSSLVVPVACFVVIKSSDIIFCYRVISKHFQRDGWRLRDEILDYRCRSCWFESPDHTPDLRQFFSQLQLFQTPRQSTMFHFTWTQRSFIVLVHIDWQNFTAIIPVADKKMNIPKIILKTKILYHDFINKGLSDIYLLVI